MDRETLWAPWRLGYIQGSESVKEPEASDLPAGADPKCFLCCAAYGHDDRASLTVARDAACVTVLNRYPYSNGHLLVSPVRHVGGLADLSDKEHLALQQQLARMTQILSEQIQAEGFNVGLNLGQVAGAGVPGHLHWHLVPRWTGDHNFMPTLAGARVIPQSLEALWEILTRALA